MNVVRVPTAVAATLAAFGLALSAAAPAHARSVEGGVTLFGRQDGVIQVHLFTDLERGGCHDAPEGTLRVLNNSDALVVIMDRPCGAGSATAVEKVMPVTFDGGNDADWPSEGRSFLLF
ncbi:hypothetical protein [Nocardiopsis sp. FIRDI 009]|uniref:hypothetical protein n=1 Tax=Nocardiopsis sp. FIRDI 009 TaxID=714197 RepID=UPI000E243545|nr:hypothetical protein [Nocardiopsis sp. FIRDI 009]